ncbi:MAG: hypothetical protein ABSA69_00635 [Verrucomicrobiota bacterium]|jgi:hypothetical protein
MAEPTITCLKCKNEIKLTESLAAPLIESTRRDYEQRLAQKDMDVAGREKSIREREGALSKAKDSLENQVAERLQQERATIAADEVNRPKFGHLPVASATESGQKKRATLSDHPIAIARSCCTYPRFSPENQDQL